MGKEIERKFLLAKGASIPIPSEFLKLRIKQGYILTSKDKQVRVRFTTCKKTNSTMTELGIKFTSKLVRDEFEYPISLQDAKTIYKKCDWFLEKDRLSFISHYTPTVQYDVDTLPNGMQWVEVEFETTKDMKKWEKNKPHWIGEEITGVRKYSNITLAKKKLKF